MQSFVNNTRQEEVQPYLQKANYGELQNKQSPNVIRPNRKLCEKCREPILQTEKQNRATLKALGRYYHEDCFTCFDCSGILKPKYFPYEDSKTKTTILLCQYDYFRRHDLLCHVCDKPLRGLYYTAFGNRYDKEHFSCSICGESCGVKRCFMNDDKLYCKYHFLKYFSKHCNGCDFPISDQYIEFPKGDEIQCWHPECYGIHKYWHVTLSSEKLGLPTIPKFEYKSDSPNDESTYTSSEMEQQIQSFSSILTKTWSTLYKFEEQTAACISDMFQHLASVDQLQGVNATALFVLKIECLFKALNSLEDMMGNNESAESVTDQKKVMKLSDLTDNRINVNFNMKKISKNLTTKLIIYLQLLRKLNETETEKVNIASFMSIITGLAHFLKLLTRYGLYLILEKDKNIHSTKPLLKFLKEIEKNEIYRKDPFSYIKISIKATDNCYACHKYIQSDCYQFQNKRWHKECLNCSSCNTAINTSNISDVTFNSNANKTLCSECSIDDPYSVPGFAYVPLSSQLVYLLKIALVRSKAMTENQLRKRGNRVGNQTQNSYMMQQTYVRTLNDISKLKSRRESIHIAKKQEARMSVVLEKTDPNQHSASFELKDQSPLKRPDKEKIRDSSSPENVFSNSRSLTLDDISRIVAAEQARELRPNAFTHFKKIKETDDDTPRYSGTDSGVYYSELSAQDDYILKSISLSILQSESKIPLNPDFTKLIPPVPKTGKPSPSAKFWNMMKIKKGKDSKKSSNRKVFGLPLEELCTKWGVQSDLGVGPSKIQVPIIVDELISSLRQMDLSVEGIFRINGNIRRLREMTELIDSNPANSPDFSEETAIQLSALLKKFIRALPEPLMTKDLYDLWIYTAKLENESKKRAYFSLLYTILPLYNRNVLEVLFSFLFWTSSFSHIENEMGSKMDIHNLSTVITPNILYTESNEEGAYPQTFPANAIDKANSYKDAFAQNEGEDHFLAIEVVDFLITHNEGMAMVPNFLTTLLKEVKGQNLNTFESIKSFLNEKIKSNSIEIYNTEEQLQSQTQQMKIVHSTSVIADSSNTTN